ncbi:uncharacterized protein LOC132747010 [Ruditapes philippinarum]|uniref:uncharacterized protein LOC132747010 n=1 Tax=Ruditapes philippinarum TaxID=129788 RepID=UPI00295ADB0F|nr:uncharacterized protein LOC132747010 [Ruditapes philippinarum]
MACKGRQMRSYKFNDFWDTLVKDIEHIEQKVKEEEEEKKSKRKGSDRQRWTEEMEIACHRRRIKRERIKAGADVKLAAKAFLIIRREALRQLLEEEEKMYKDELSQSNIEA